ncbi:MAG TPA: redoxin domain-containing protein [Gemmatimonadales bacterium]|nr:redoxin domain-containing protein [Gemmatimonadales bacterium]
MFPNPTARTASTARSAGSGSALSALTALTALSLLSAPLRAQQTGQPEAILASGPDVGTRAPDFSLPWADKDSLGAPDLWFSLSGQKGQVVVLIFYPRDFTNSPSEMLTRIAQDSVLGGGRAVVVGISSDSLTTHQRFAASLGLPFRLLGDSNYTVAKRWGAFDRSGSDRRVVYVIDRKGRVAYQDLQFVVSDPKEYTSLQAAVKRALKS